MMILETGRLLLRPFADRDAADVYEYAKDPRVGPDAGWPPHRDLAESLEIIRTVFAQPHVFALELKEEGKVVGSAGYVGRHQVLLPGPDDEIGYALHPDWWGQGLMTEAVAALLERGFCQRGLEAIWASHYAENVASRRVIEKSGFSPVCRETVWDETGEHETCFYVLLRQQWRGV